MSLDGSSDLNLEHNCGVWQSAPRTIDVTILVFGRSDDPIRRCHQFLATDLWCVAIVTCEDPLHAQLSSALCFLPLVLLNCKDLRAELLHIFAIAMQSTVSVTICKKQNDVQVV